MFSWTKNRWKWVDPPRSEGGDGEPDPVESLESGYQDQFGGPFPRWVLRTLSKVCGFGGLFPRVPHIIYIIHLPFLNWDL